MRILIVEDDICVMEVLYGLLEKPYTEIDCADSCRLALALLVDNRYDWVVLDYRLGDGTGLDILEVIHGNSPATKTLLITGSMDAPMLVVEAKRLGAVGVFPKPIHGAELIARVHGAIR